MPAVMPLSKGTDPMIRRICSATALLLLVSLAFGADWPQYRGPNHDAISPENGIQKNWPAAGPKVIWKIPAGESFGSIAVVGKRAYLMVERNGNEICICIDADNG